MNHSEFVRFCLALLVGAASGASLQAAPAEPAYHCYYFDQARPLTLDVQRIALLSGSGSDDDQAPGLAAALQQADLDAAALTPWSGQWQLAALPPHQRSAAAIERLIADLVKDGGGFVAPVFVDNLGGPLVVTPDVLVRFRVDVAPWVAEAILIEAGSDAILARDWAGLDGAYRVRMKSRSGFEVLAAANALAHRNDVIFAEPDFLFTGTGAGQLPSDEPLFSIQWHLHNTGQPMCDDVTGLAGFDVDGLEALTVTTGHSDIIIAVFDTGVQLDHPDLMLDGALSTDVTNQGSGGWPTHACENHGTAVAGVTQMLLNGVGGAGVAPGCRVASVRTFIGILASPCTTNWTTQPSWTVDALAWAETIGARVTNNSNGYGFTSAAIDSKYDQTRFAGMVHFSIAGNQGQPQIRYPGSLCSVNAVAWLTPFGVISTSSNYGDGLGFGAPGGRIITTDRTGPDGFNPSDYACTNGTSYASPIAAGVAALILSQNPDLSALEVESIMQRSAGDLGGPGYDTIYGWGMVNAHDALTIPTFSLADITLDGLVNVADLLSVINSWGSCPGICPAPCPADVTGDRQVNVSDLLLVINNWGQG